MTKIFSLLIIITLFMGCIATKSQIKAKMDPLVGKDINYVIINWGAPTNVYKLPSGGLSIYTWLYQGGSYITATQYAGVTYGQTGQSYCKIELTTNDQNVIIKYRTEGDCVIKK